jgi:hypothetical protein
MLEIAELNGETSNNNIRLVVAILAINIAKLAATTLAILIAITPLKLITITPFKRSAYKVTRSRAASNIS